MDSKTWAKMLENLAGDSTPTSAGFSENSQSHCEKEPAMPSAAVPNIHQHTDNYWCNRD